MTAGSRTPAWRARVAAWLDIMEALAAGHEPVPPVAAAEPAGTAL
jgi:hypothetical protein